MVYYFFKIFKNRKMKNTPPINLEDILTDRFKEENFLEISLRNEVFKVFWWLVLILGFIAIFQLINLNVVHGSFYKNRSLANMSYSVIEPAPRGIIYDRFGKPIVYNEPSLNVFLVPHELPKDINERGNVIKKIGAILGIDEQKLALKLKEKDWRFSEKLLLISDPSYEKIALVENSRLPGLRLESSFKRVPRSPRVFSHILGFVGLVGKEDLENNPDLFIDDEIGKAGLEAYYDEYLRGVNGRDVFLRDAFGEIKDRNKSVIRQAGSDLQTFIDAEFQEYFYNRLRQGLLELGREVGVGIAINPKNGEVLALFSIPGIDVRELPLFLEGENQPFFNRSISGLYTPGSTIKPLHAVVALKEGIIKPESQIFSGGFIEVPNPYNPNLPSRFLDWKAHGWVDMKAAIARSSNVYFYEIGGGFKSQEGLGIERLRTWWQKFGLDEKTGIDLLGEAKGFLPSPTWKEEVFHEPWRLGDTYNVSIGQGDLLVTPIGLLNYISAIANGGTFYRLRIANFGQTEVLRDLSGDLKESVGIVQEGMRDVVSKPYGTAYLLNYLPISVAAKTGTAQVLNNEKLNAFFVGYAPYEDPQIAILILIEDAREGSLNTVPVAQDVFLWYYNHRIKP